MHRNTLTLLFVLRMLKPKTYHNFLTEIEGNKLWSYANSAQYVRNWKSDAYSHKENGRFVHHFSPDYFKTEFGDLWLRIIEEVGYPLHLNEAYLNGSNGLTKTLPHYDSYYEDSPSIIIYVNPEWHKEWGGYTIFFKGIAESEVLHTEIPEYRKMIIFDPSVPHMALPPIFDGPDRFTLAMKTQRNG